MEAWMHFAQNDGEAGSSYRQNKVMGKGDRGRKGKKRWAKNRDCRSFHKKTPGGNNPHFGSEKRVRGEKHTNKRLPAMAKRRKLWGQKSGGVHRYDGSPVRRHRRGQLGGQRTRSGAKRKVNPEQKGRKGGKRVNRSPTSTKGKDLWDVGGKGVLNSEMKRPTVKPGSEDVKKDLLPRDPLYTLSPKLPTLKKEEGDSPPG